MKLYFFTGLILWLCTLQVFAQPSGKLTGYVKDSKTQEPLIGVTVKIDSINKGAATNASGYYVIKNIEPGNYTVTASYIGYKAVSQYDVRISSGNVRELNFALEEKTREMDEVKVKARPFAKDPATPTSVQSLSAKELTSFPGGNNDVARVAQSLPGVAGSAGFRNDLIIRGGAPVENVYYLDGIRVPAINHFSTQGSTGGPVGMLNVSLVENVELNSSAFHARYDDAMSGVLKFDQQTGSKENLQGNVRVGFSEAGATLEGPLQQNGNTTFMISARRSYLQFLFDLINLPFLPAYWDYQYKITHKPDNKNTFVLTGLGSIDDFTFNPPRREEFEEGEEGRIAYIDRLATLENIPENEQWTSTAGFSWKRLIDEGYWKWVVSGNMLDNQAIKYDNNRKGVDSLKRLDFHARETEGRSRFEMTRFMGDWTLTGGAGLIYVHFFNNTFNRIPELRTAEGNLRRPGFNVSFSTDLRFARFGPYVQLDRKFLSNRLSFSAGLRSDMNTFTTTGMQGWQTLSPRMGLSYALNEKWNINASAGRFFRLPQYLTLGFRDTTGSYVNKDAAYIRSDHLVAGFEYFPRRGTRISLEGFYKKYKNYPVSEEDNISLANLGGGFGIVGNEAVNSKGLGRAYGAECMLRQKLTANFYGILAYTFYRSAYTNARQQKYVPSSWDYRHILTFTGGYRLPRQWEIGARIRFLGKNPYTPLDTALSRPAYAQNRQTVKDYDRINTERVPGYYFSFDIRVDKKWNFNNWSLNVYWEVQNFNNPAPPSYTFDRNNQGEFITTDGKPLNNLSGQNAKVIRIDQHTFNTIPTIGMLVEF